MRMGMKMKILGHCPKKHLFSDEKSSVKILFSYEFEGKTPYFLFVFV